MPQDTRDLFGDFAQAAAEESNASTARVGNSWLPDDALPEWAEPQAGEAIPDPPAPAETKPAIFLDRSRLQDYRDCAGKGMILELGLAESGSAAADSGNQVHAAIASAIGAYAESGVDPKFTMREAMPGFRPDVATDARRGLRGAVWSIADWITDHNPRDFIGYQGGGDEHSPQLASLLVPETDTSPALYATAELDVLLAGVTETERESVDWKTGNYEFSTVDVRKAFQFQLHAHLVFHNSPGVECLRVTVWNTRSNHRVPAVPFYRNDVADMPATLSEIARHRWRALRGAAECYIPKPNAAEPGELAAALSELDRRAEADGESLFWPDGPKCDLCPGAVFCPRATAPAREFAADPRRFIADLAALQASIAERMATLRNVVDDRGDIVLPDGTAFGLNAPKQVRKPAAYQYRLYRDPDAHHKPAKPPAKPCKPKKPKKPPMAKSKKPAKPPGKPA